MEAYLLKITPEDMEAARALLAQGWTPERVADALGMTVHQVRRIAQAGGLPLVQVPLAVK